ncbi:P-loop containing nucleoside triphosphate hydrolase protein [Tribonema minus]|uniref:P-loop containing nucleoside triphosphate hydrolase protein n=1 Tax=Tribonema minus TaxID=303371 RepID=A0A835YR02_9STRA|nr:P-loop containing nucleoside triphosphate hydrolase protein [Tribonema minus]
MAATADLEQANQLTLRAGQDGEDLTMRRPLTANVLGGLQESVDDDTSSIRSRTDNPAILTFKDLVVTAKARNQVLLKGISGQMRGGFWACMGPSGSGKSTLLNTLALRLDRAVSVSGDLRLNGRSYDNAELKRMSGYVMQDDLLNGNLTCEETLDYTARLRCPQDKTDAMRKVRVDRVLQQMGLEHARHTIVGTPLRKGISGGERKRLSVGLELLVEPKLLFLDEPTSGLDSVTALMLCNILREISETCTVVCTIHQPQSKIYSLFDNLILLKAGDIAYQGPAREALAFFEQTGYPCPYQGPAREALAFFDPRATHAALAFFEQTGYPCPPLTNPADHLLDSISMTRTDSSHSLMDLDVENDLHLRFTRPLSCDLDVENDLHLRFTRPHFDLHHGVDKPRLQQRETTSWWHQFTVLLERSLKDQSRKRFMMITQITQVCIMAILIGFAFYDIGTDQKSVTLRKPVLFFCVINQGLFSALSTINSFPGERMLSLRERAAGTYYTSAYFMAKVLAETVMQIILPILFTCIVYFLIGLQNEASKFFIFMAFMVLCSLAATSLALLVSAFCRTTDLSVTVLPFMLEICRLFGAFFLSPANTPGYFVWLDALSYVKYCYVGVSLNENHGLTLTCTPEEEIDVGGITQCPIPNGDAFLESQGMENWTMGACAGILVFYIFFARFLAYLGVRFLKY